MCPIDDQLLPDDKEIYLEFKAETLSQLEHLEEVILKMEQGNSVSDGVSELFRVMHSIKGTAGFFGLDALGKLAHLAETLLSAIRDHQAKMTQKVTNLLLDTVDLLGQMLQSKEETGQLERVTAKLQAELEQPAELEDLPKIEEVTRVEEPRLQAAEQQSIRLNVHVLDQLLELIGDVVLGRNQLLAQLQDDPLFSSLSTCITKLHRHVIQTRMQPIGTIFQRYHRMIRDLSNQTGKEVELVIEGADIELDRTLLEKISDPLTHLIRNAVDHGLETPLERSKTNKQPTGKVWLRAYLESGQINMEVEDDGKGMNETRILEKAVKMGLIPAEQAVGLNPEDIYPLVFRPGFSTNEQANELSGRGVGMDVVETNLKALGFSLEIQSKAGQGTRFSARMPLTQAVVNSAVISALMIRYAGHCFALPEMAVSEMLSLGQDEINKDVTLIKGKQVLHLRESVIPLIALGQILGLKQENNKGQRRRSLFVVMQFKKNRFAFSVDEIIGTEEVVVKRLPQLLKSRGIFEGTTQMSTGTIAMILDVNGMVEKAGFSFAQTSLGNLQRDSALNEKAQSQVLILEIAQGEWVALDLDLVDGIHKIKGNEIHRFGRQEFVWVNGKNLRLLRLDHFMELSALPTQEEYYVLESHEDTPFGFLATCVIDHTEFDGLSRLEETCEEGLIGRFYYRNQLVSLLDLPRLQHAHYEIDGLTADEEALANYRILVVEDTLFYRELVMGYLRSFGVSQVIAAANGLEALEILAQSAPFDLLISDIEMPIMNGLELAEKVRENQNYDHMPMLALTGLNQEEDRRRCLSAGFSAFESKVNRQKVLATVLHLIQQSNEVKL